MSKFTVRAKGRLKALLSDCLICEAHDPTIKRAKKTNSKSYRCLWDTGASGTVITSQVARDLGLKPTGRTFVDTANGRMEVPVYMVNVILPNNVMVSFVTVTEGNLNGFDVLIGMDITTLGDFAITNAGNKTVFSFQIPSQYDIDFKKNPDCRKASSSQKKQRRNEPCSCGSGKKYKDCHGKP